MIISSEQSTNQRVSLGGITRLRCCCMILLSVGATYLVNWFHQLLYSVNTETNCWSDSLPNCWPVLNNATNCLVNRLDQRLYQPIVPCKIALMHAVRLTQCRALLHLHVIPVKLPFISSHVRWTAYANHWAAETDYNDQCFFNILLWREFFNKWSHFLRSKHA